MNKYLLCLAVAFCFVSHASADEYSDRLSKAHEDSYRMKVESGLYTTRSLPNATPAAKYQPWMYLPIQIGGSSAYGSVYTPGQYVPASQTGSNVYVLY